MELVINNIKIEVEKLEDIYKNLSEYVDDESVVSEIIIDNSYYNDPDRYIEKEFSSINKIEMIVRNKKDIVYENLDMTYEYIESNKLIIEDLAKEFYLNPNDEDWSSFQGLIDSLEWIISVFTIIDEDMSLKKYIKNLDVWIKLSELIETLLLNINRINESLINQDYILIGDIILYEVLDIIKKVSKKIYIILELEG